MELYIVISMPLNDDEYPAVKVFAGLFQAKEYAKTVSGQWTIERHVCDFLRSETIIDWG